MSGIVRRIRTFWLLLLLYVGCGGGGSVEQLCIPGETNVCECANEGEIILSTQLCLSSGEGFGECNCQEVQREPEAERVVQSSSSLPIPAQSRGSGSTVPSSDRRQVDDEDVFGNDGGDDVSEPPSVFLPSDDEDVAQTDVSVRRVYDDIETEDVSPAEPVDDTWTGSTSDTTSEGSKDGVYSKVPFWKVEYPGGETVSWRHVHGVTQTKGSPHYLMTGEGGKVALYEGNKTTPRNLDVTATILAGWEDEEGGIVVVGEDGLVRQWDSDDEEWLFGQPAGLPPGSALGALYAVYGTSPENIYLGGENGAFYHWKGSTWLSMSGVAPIQGYETIDSIWVSEQNIVYVVAGKRIYHGQGINWQVTEMPKAMKSIYGFASDDVYAVGGFGGTGFADSISHFTAQGWKAQSTPAPSAQGLNDVWGTSTDMVLAIGFNGLLLKLSTEVDGQWDMVSNTITSSDYYALKNPSDPTLKGDEDTLFQASFLKLESISGLSEDDIVILAQPSTADAGVERLMIRFARRLINP